MSHIGEVNTLLCNVMVEAFITKNSYWERKISDEKGKPSKLWKSLSTILRRDKNENGPSAPSKHSAEDFLNFFQEKVANVRASTSGNARPEETDKAVSSLTGFQEVSDDDVRRIIMASPTKSVHSIRFRHSSSRKFWMYCFHT